MSASPKSHESSSGNQGVSKRKNRKTDTAGQPTEVFNTSRNPIQSLVNRTCSHFANCEGDESDFYF